MAKIANFSNFISLLSYFIAQMSLVATKCVSDFHNRYTSNLSYFFGYLFRIVRNVSDVVFSSQNADTIVSGMTLTIVVLSDKSRERGESSIFSNAF